MQYPVAYRPGSSRYRSSPQAFGSGGRGSGIEGQPGGLFPERPFTSRPTLDLERGPTGAWRLPASQAFPREPLPYGPPLQKASTGFPGISRGALLRGAARMTPIGRYVDMANLAYELANRGLGGSFQGSWMFPSGWTTCVYCFQGTEARFTGLGGVGSCTVGMTCNKNAGDPGGLHFPTPLSNLCVEIKPSPLPQPFGARYDTAAWRAKTVASAGNPYRLSWPFELMFKWWNFAELMLPQQPYVEPDPLPFAVRPYAPGDKGYDLPAPTPEAGDEPAFPPPFEPTTVPLSDAHRRPGRFTSDRKFRNPAVTRLLTAVGRFTEFDDALECAWKSLPKDARRPIYGRKFAGDTIYNWSKRYAASKGISPEARERHNAQWRMGRYVHQSPQNALGDLAKAAMSDARGETANFDHDYEKRLVVCLAENEVVDQAIGRASRKTVQNLNRFQKRTTGSTRWMHIGSGPAL